jgi:hypothetical protein
MDVTELNVMLAEDLRDLVGLDMAVFVVVEKFETLINGESFVTKEGLSCILNLSVVSDHHL